jgi:hypothetical protein
MRFNLWHDKVKVGEVITDKPLVKGDLVQTGWRVVGDGWQVDAADPTNSVSSGNVQVEPATPLLSADEFRHELFRMMTEAQNGGKEYVEISAGELHKRVGGYPGRNHRMPNCCQVMKAQLALDYGDTVLDEPESGQGASLTIRYRLPRRERAEP